MLNWHHDPVLDMLTARGRRGTYRCVRTPFDSSVLWLDEERIGVCGSGSHEASKAKAEEMDAR